MARLPDSPTHRLRIEIASETSKRKYIVSQRIANRQWECSCRGWISHRKCKHLTETQEVRMKLEKSFGPSYEEHNGAKGSSSDWKKALEDILPEEKAPSIEKKVRRIDIDEL